MRAAICTARRSSAEAGTVIEGRGAVGFTSCRQRRAEPGPMSSILSALFQNATFRRLEGTWTLPGISTEQPFTAGLITVTLTGRCLRSRRKPAGGWNRSASLRPGGLLMRSRKLSIGLTVVLAILTATLLVTGTRAAAQTETVLYSFSGNNGTFPEAGLIFDTLGSLY